MVFFKKTRKATKRYRRKTIGNRRSRAGKVPRLGQLRRTILPARLPTKLKAELSGNSTALTTILHSLVLRAGSINDVLFTGGVVRPRGYNELAALYRKYKVFGLKVKVSCSVAVGATAFVGFVTIPDNAALPTTTNGAMESRRCWGKIIGAESDKVHVIQRYFSIPAVQEISKRQFTDDDYSALFGADPIQDAHVAFVVGSPDQATTTTVNYNMEMTYYVTLSQSKLLTQS